MTTSLAWCPPLGAAGSPGRWIATSSQGVAPRTLTCGEPASVTSVTGTLTLTLSTVRLCGKTYVVGGVTTPRRKS